MYCIRGWRWGARGRGRHPAHRGGSRGGALGEAGGEGREKKKKKKERERGGRRARVAPRMGADVGGRAGWGGSEVGGGGSGGGWGWRKGGMAGEDGRGRPWPDTAVVQGRGRRNAWGEKADEGGPPSFRERSRGGSASRQQRARTLSGVARRQPMTHEIVVERGRRNNTREQSREGQNEPRTTTDAYRRAQREGGSL